MAQVTAMAQVEAEELVAWLQACHEHSHIGLRSRMRLHVGPLRSKKLLKPLYSQSLCLVNHLAAAIVTVPGIAFCILVGEARPHSLHHLVTDEIL